jgi:segregation and condensation protein A
MASAMGSLTAPESVANGTGASFVVELTQFSGPLDLLLALLREEQIDIYDIPIARVAEQFLDRIHDLALDEAADYLEMAARLLRIKAQMLLPRHDGEEAWDDPRAELVRRLLEYQQMREVVDVLERHADMRRDRFARPVPTGSLLTAWRAPGPLALDLMELLAALDRVVRAGGRVAVHAVVPRALDVLGAMALVRASLEGRAHVNWETILRDASEPWEVLSLLLAVLELARLGECVVYQPAPFAPLELTRGSVLREDRPRDIPGDASVAADSSSARPGPADTLTTADIEPASAAA